jgi:hypothetical protein
VHFRRYPGLDCRDDDGAIAKEKFIATQIAIDSPSSIIGMSLF